MPSENLLNVICKQQRCRSARTSAQSDEHHFAVLPAKSDNDVIFVYKVISDLELIDHLCINPICRKGLIHMWSIA